jgi:hypothetical protein
MALKQLAKVKTAVTATQELVLEPALKKKLEQRLEIYRKLDAEYDLAKAKRDKEKANIEGYFEQAGANSIEVSGHAKLTEVRGVSSTLDKKKFVELGGSLKMLEDATVTRPKRPYLLISLEDRK